MTVLRGWGLPEQHLALDALVAFVDGELTPNAYDRAASHLARCPACTAEAGAQRQARAAVRAATAPTVSPRLLQALQSIPTDADLPGQPDELALTEDGQLVTVTRQDNSRKRFGSGPVLGSSTPLGGNQQPFAAAVGSDGVQASVQPRQSRFQGRRTRQGAGVVFSGLVLGALAFMNLPPDDLRELPKVPVPLPDSYRNSFTPASAKADAPAPPANDAARPPAMPQPHPVVASSAVPTPAPDQ